MWSKFCGLMLRMLGWKTVGGPAPEEKCVILGAPHTSVWDFVISYLFYRQFGIGAKVMIKKEFFVGPLGWLIKALGGIPVDRSNATSMILSLIEQMEKPGIFHLAIAPEGTRKPVNKWKTGYHLIAKKIGCPVYLGYFDWATKRVSIGEKFQLTDDARGDTDKIQAEYEKLGVVGKHPERFITH